MKKIASTLMGSVAALCLCAQAYLTDIGNPAIKERLHDAIVVDTPPNSLSLVAGVTNADGYDRVLITALDQTYGNLIYQKKYNIAYPTSLKEITVITSVKIAHDNNSASTTCMLVGSYMRTSVNGLSVFGYGLFSATVDATTGNILNIKRWESSAAGVTAMSVASVCAGPGNTFYATGNIVYAGPEKYTYMLALNSSNALLWNKIEHDVPTLTGAFIVTDVIYSPYVISGVNEVVQIGYTRPYAQGYPSNVFFRRFNAVTGALVAQNLFTTNTLESHTIASIIPSRSAAGVYDGFWICGNLLNDEPVSFAWVIKTNTTGTAITWSKDYKYDVSGSQFVASDLSEAWYNGLDPYAFYLTGTATNGISGTTSDAAAFKIDANGSVLWLTSVTPTHTTNKNEESLVVVQHAGITEGFDLFGNRVNTINPAQSDMCSIRLADFNLPTGAVHCDDLTSTPYLVNNVILSVIPFTTQDFAVLNSQTMNYNISILSNATEICFEDFLVGGRKQQTLSAENTPGNEEAFSIFPNPSAGTCTLSRTSVVPAVVEVNDLLGKSVCKPLTMTGKTLDMDLSELPAGIYVVSIITATEVKTIRLVKE